MDLAEKLPPGLLDAFRLAALEATAHVEHYCGSCVIEAKLSKRDRESAVQVSVRLKEKEWLA